MAFKKDRVPRARKMARPGQDSHARRRLERRLSRCRELHATLVRAERGQEKQSNFDLPEFNKLYEQAKALPDSPERTKLFNRMTELAIAYAPWRLTYHLLEDSVRHSWIRTYVPHPIRSQSWQYIDVDLAQRPR
jgi:ABC-type transport system substrate-binding protein